MMRLPIVLECTYSSGSQGSYHPKHSCGLGARYKRISVWHTLGSTKFVFSISDYVLGINVPSSSSAGSPPLMNLCSKNVVHLALSSWYAYQTFSGWKKKFFRNVWCPKLFHFPDVDSSDYAWENLPKFTQLVSPVDTCVVLFYTCLLIFTSAYVFTAGISVQDTIHILFHIFSTLNSS